MYISFKQVEHFFESRATIGIKPGLDRVVGLLDAVDNPQKDIKAVHIAGTNGKGSTLQFLHDSLMSSNYSVGVFTSPSMTGLCGHIKINNTSINKLELMAYLNRLLPTIGELDEQNDHPSEFEIMTTIAFLYFKEQGVDIGLVEAGMGGRSDTTNCLKPLVSIITNIEKDHHLFLGDTLEQVTYEKVGIIKRDTPVIIGDIHKESERTLAQEVNMNHAKLFRLNKDFSYELVNRQSFDYIDNAGKSFRITLKNMLGKHQIENATIAIKALVLLEELELKIDWSNVLLAFGRTTVEGRFEQISLNPLIIIDGAHNEASIKAFIETTMETYKESEKHLIFAAFKDKALCDILRLFNNEFNSITFTTFDHPRAATDEQLKEKYQYKETAFSSSRWQSLINEVLNQNNKDAVYFVTGSLYFISLVRQYIKEVKLK